ncbi:hypothetical protein CIHG_04958 [Coccidioides immitis H538.4]|uniref:Uncharacterized protein n=2 Tax=Coccidioides immitis TaxID=5501 RepID=A0A0J8UHW3_COCIT|nr:hypothetical protein CIRG_05467 [Coccidioides immitis RMSCC 2394]KMU87018.1 hypothetical protein CIHG_04958 [Coccidioides immitis H538.4]
MSRCRRYTVHDALTFSLSCLMACEAEPTFSPCLWPVSGHSSIYWDRYLHGPYRRTLLGLTTTDVQDYPPGHADKSTVNAASNFPTAQSKILETLNTRGLSGIHPANSQSKSEAKEPHDFVFRPCRRIRGTKPDPVI